MTEIEAVVESTKNLDLSPRRDDTSSNEDVEENHENGHPAEDEAAAAPAPAPAHSGTLHPLEFEWTFWYDKRPAAGKRMKGEQESYENNLRPIGTFGTVEDFWRYYNHLVKPSRLEINSNYHFFKEGIKPMWEDSANSKGGKWVLTFRDKSLLDMCWENVVLGLVGETLDMEDEITGAVVSRRKAGDRIAIWNRSKDNEAAILGVGRKLKSLFGVDPNKVNSSYQSHEDSMKSGASYSNPSRYKL
jgi:translation initiation factor 4E